MATPEQCPNYERCGFVKYRIKRPSAQIEPLPGSGDCGIKIDGCARRTYLFTQDPEIRSLMNKASRTINVYTDELPINDEELKVAFPSKENSHGRPERRLTGGGNR